MTKAIIDNTEKNQVLLSSVTLGNKCFTLAIHTFQHESMKISIENKMIDVCDSLMPHNCDFLKNRLFLCYQQVDLIVCKSSVSFQQQVYRWKQNCFCWNSNSYWRDRNEWCLLNTNRTKSFAFRYGSSLQCLRSSGNIY